MLAERLIKQGRCGEVALAQSHTHLVLQDLFTAIETRTRVDQIRTTLVLETWTNDLTQEPIDK